MMRFRISRQAEADLEAIAAYIGDRNASSAGREVRRLFDKFVLLGKNPLLGELRQELPGIPRSFTAGSFVILYKSTANGIEIARVVHAARDLPSLLGQNHKATGRKTAWYSREFLPQFS
jgi:toxin ParE1/3/4